MSKRIRLLISRGEESKYLSHLDVSRIWVRACRRAGLNIKYSEGFSPNPKLIIASPLPVGVMAKADFLEIECEETARTVMQVLPSALPLGFGVHSAIEVAASLPSLQSLVSSAEYEVLVNCNFTYEELFQKIETFMDSESVIFKRVREGSSKEFNIRPLVLSAQIVSLQDGLLKMHLCLMCSPEGTGRCDEFCASTGLPVPISITRTRLFLRN